MTNSLESVTSLKSVTFTLDEESRAIVERIPKSRRSYVLRGVLKQLPNVIDTLNIEGEALSSIVKVTANISISEGYLLFLDGFCKKISCQQIREMLVKSTFYEVVHKIEELLSKDNIYVKREELVNKIYEITQEVKE